MRIAIPLFFDGFFGGAELHTAQLAAALERRRHEVVLFVKEEQEASLLSFLKNRGFDPGRFEIRPFPLSLCDSVRGCSRFLSDIGRAAIVCPKGGYGSGSLLLEITARLRSIPYVSIEHQTPPTLEASNRTLLRRVGVWQWRYRFRFWLRSIGPRRIVTVSPTGRQRFVNELWYGRKKTIAVSNGVDVQWFCPDQAARAATRNQLGIPADAVVLGTLCRLVPNKRIGMALDALQSILEGNPPIRPHFVIWGDGPSRKELEARMQSSQLSGYVHWGGAPAEARSVYPAMDFFLLSSLSEGLPLAMLEAMACGCIPVAVPVGGVPDVYVDGVHGILADAVDSAGFEHAVRRALALTPDERSALSQRTIERVRQDFNLERQFARLCDCIEEVAR